MVFFYVTSVWYSIALKDEKYLEEIIVEIDGTILGKEDT